MQKMLPLKWEKEKKYYRGKMYDKKCERKRWKRRPKEDIKIKWPPAEGKERNIASTRTTIKGKYYHVGNYIADVRYKKMYLERKEKGKAER